jgi:hypothetical protein
MEANRVNGRPSRLGPSYHDQFAGAYAVIGILASMLQPRDSNAAGHVEVGLYETGLHVASRDLVGVPPTHSFFNVRIFDREQQHLSRARHGKRSGPRGRNRMARLRMGSRREPIIKHRVSPFHGLLRPVRRRARRAIKSFQRFCKITTSTEVVFE